MSIGKQVPMIKIISLILCFAFNANAFAYSSVHMLTGESHSIAAISPSGGSSINEGE